MSEPATQTSGLVQSRLLPELFAGYEEGDPLTVLDLGTGSASTVAFLSRFRAKIFFADLLEHPMSLAAGSEPNSLGLQQAIARQLALPDDIQIDVCLLWDYLHYIELPTLEALSTVLSPRLHRSSRGYGFGALHGHKPLDSNRYGIADRNHLIAQPEPNEPKYHAHSQQRLNEHFPAMRIRRGTLLREGRLELLFSVD